MHSAAVGACTRSVLAKADGGRGVTVETGALVTIEVGGASFEVNVNFDKNRTELEPGTNDLARIQAAEPLSLSLGTRFPIRSDGQLVGIGMVTHP